MASNKPVLFICQQAKTLWIVRRKLNNPSMFSGESGWANYGNFSLFSNQNYSTVHDMCGRNNRCCHLAFEQRRSFAVLFGNWATICRGNERSCTVGGLHQFNLNLALFNHECCWTTACFFLLFFCVFFVYFCTII